MRVGVCSYVSLRRVMCHACVCACLCEVIIRFIAEKPADDVCEMLLEAIQVP